MELANPTSAFNDDRRRIFGRGEAPIAFVCEAEGDGCRTTVVLTAAEFDRIRAAEPYRLLCPRHAKV